MFGFISNQVINSTTKHKKNAYTSTQLHNKYTGLSVHSQLYKYFVQFTVALFSKKNQTSLTEKTVNRYLMKHLLKCFTTVCLCLKYITYKPQQNCF